jgi:hypothetical protein
MMKLGEHREQLLAGQFDDDAAITVLCPHGEQFIADAVSGSNLTGVILHASAHRPAHHLLSLPDEAAGEQPSQSPA